jgi:hypothetical protein
MLCRHTAAVNRSTGKGTGRVSAENASPHTGTTAFTAPRIDQGSGTSWAAMRPISEVMSET